jgi:hypothetical protein
LRGKALYYKIHKQHDVNFVNYEEGEELYIPAYSYKNEPNFLRLIHHRVVQMHGDQDYEDRIQ